MLGWVSPGTNTELTSPTTESRCMHTLLCVMPLKISPRTVQVSGWVGGCLVPDCARVENVSFRTQALGDGRRLASAWMCAIMFQKDGGGWLVLHSFFFSFLSFFNYIFLTKESVISFHSPDSPPPLTTRGEGYRGFSALGMIRSISGNISPGRQRVKAP